MIRSDNNATVKDPGFLDNVYKSTFKTDYFTVGCVKKQAIFDPPKPAQLQHRENGLDMSKSVSVARTGFPDPTNKSSPHTYKETDLVYKTNFKIGESGPMQGDTVMSHFFQASKVEPVADTKSIKNKWMTSYVPNGDPEKVNNRVTHYAKHYPGYECQQQKRATSKHYTVGNSVTHAHDVGKERFHTSNRSTYPAHPSDGVITSSRPYAAIERSRHSVPSGDKDHPKLLIQNIGTSLRQVYPRYNRSNISDSQKWRANMVDDRYITNIKMGNMQQSAFPTECNTEQSSRFGAFAAADMYPLERTNIWEKRNHSDVPQGDEIQHMSKTMNTTNYKPHNPDRVNIHKPNRNLSFVNFGDASSHFESTTDASYVAIEPAAHPEIKCKTKCNKYDTNVAPLPYKEQEDGKPKMSTITMDDFDNKKSYQRLKLHAERKKNLKCSHIFRKHEEDNSVKGIGTSTQDDLYRPPAKSAFTNITHEHDPGWLQRSNVPLGTLGTHIPGCHKGWY